MYLELRIAGCALMLAIASILDIKSREIPDKVWIVFAAAGAALTAFQLSLEGVPADYSAFVIHYAAGIAIVSAIGYIAYRAGLFGGADPKALVAIAVILPEYGPGFQLGGFPALGVLSNAVIISLTAMVYNVARNSISVVKRVPIFEGMEQEGMARKALAFAVGFPATQSRGKYVFAMEEIDDSGKRRFMFNPAGYHDFAGQEGRQEKLWVTRALPFIVYISAGFAVTIIFGDLMALFARYLLAHI